MPLHKFEESFWGSGPDGVFLVFYEIGNDGSQQAFFQFIAVEPSYSGSCIHTYPLS